MKTASSSSSSSTSSLLSTLLLAVLWLGVSSSSSAAARSPTQRHLPKASTSFTTSSRTFLAFVPQRNRSRIPPEDVVLSLRGGAYGDDDTDVDEVEEEQGEEDDDVDVAEVKDEVDEEDSEDEYDNEDDEEEDMDDTTLASSIKSKQKKKGGTATKLAEYDEPYSMPLTMTLYSTLLPILISRKVDLYKPAIVRTLRFLFIGLLILQQAFIFYVRIMAKSRNDRTVVHVKSPFDDAVNSKMAEMGGGTNEMLKKMASSFLTKDTTVMEYDMDQAKGMQTGIIFSILMTWIIHFKLQQVQFLLITIINGVLQLIFNPLFQTYVLGRNLERPFITPKPEWLKMQEAAMAERQNATSTTTTTDEAGGEIEEAIDEDEVEVEATIEEVEEEDEDEEGEEQVEQGDNDNEEGGNEEEAE